MAFESDRLRTLSNRIDHLEAELRTLRGELEGLRAVGAFVPLVPLPNPLVFGSVVLGAYTDQTAVSTTGK